MPEKEGLENPETPDSPEGGDETPTPEGVTPMGGSEEPAEPTEATVPISELRKIRAEAAKYRKELQALQERQKKERRDTELAKMEETERLKAIAAEAEAKAKVLRERADKVAKRAAIINVASTLNFYNPSHAAGILDLEQIVIDDDGKVDESQITDMLKELAENSPYMVKGAEKTTEFGGGPTNPPPAPGAQPRTPKLTDAEMTKQLRERSREAMSKGRVSDAVRLYNQAWEKEHGIKRGG